MRRKAAAAPLLAAALATLLPPSDCGALPAAAASSSCRQEVPLLPKTCCRCGCNDGKDRSQEGQRKRCRVHLSAGGSHVGSCAGRAGYCHGQAGVCAGVGGGHGLGSRRRVIAAWTILGLHHCGSCALPGREGAAFSRFSPRSNAWSGQHHRFVAKARPRVHIAAAAAAAAAAVASPAAPSAPILAGMQYRLGAAGGGPSFGAEFGRDAPERGLQGSGLGALPIEGEQWHRSPLVGATAAAAAAAAASAGTAMTVSMAASGQQPFHYGRDRTTAAAAFGGGFGGGSAVAALPGKRPPGTGLPHTVESKAKISAANRGKVPWNKGGRHSDETRAKIAAATKRAMQQRKLEQLAAQGLTLEEYEEQRRLKREQRAKAGPYVATEETRAKISERLRQRWKDPAYREKRLATMPQRLGLLHTDETKEKIRAKIAGLWQNPEYREAMKAKQVAPETKAKIAQVLRDRWQDPVFRAEKMAGMTTKSEEHKRRISEAIKAKWADPAFRTRTTAAMNAARGSSEESGVAKKAAKPRKRPASTSGEGGGGSGRSGRATTRRTAAVAIGGGSGVIREEERLAMEAWLAQAAEMMEEKERLDAEQEAQQRGAAAAAAAAATAAEAGGAALAAEPLGSLPGEPLDFEVRQQWPADPLQPLLPPSNLDAGGAGPLSSAQPAAAGGDNDDGLDDLGAVESELDRLLGLDVGAAARGVDIGGERAAPRGRAQRRPRGGASAVGTAFGLLGSRGPSVAGAEVARGWGRSSIPKGGDGDRDSARRGVRALTLRAAAAAAAGGTAAARAKVAKAAAADADDEEAFDDEDDDDGADDDTDRPPSVGRGRSGGGGGDAASEVSDDDAFEMVFENGRTILRMK